MKIELDFPDFLKLYASAGFEIEISLNPSKREIALHILELIKKDEFKNIDDKINHHDLLFDCLYKNLKHKEVIENFKEQFAGLNLYSLAWILENYPIRKYDLSDLIDLLGKELSNYELVDIVNTQQEFFDSEDEFLNSYIYLNIDFEGDLHKEDFNIEKILNLDVDEVEKYLYNIFSKTNNDVVFKNCLTVLQEILPSKNSTQANKILHSKLIMKYFDAIKDNYSFVSEFEKVFPYIEEAYDIVELNEIKVRNEAEHISKMQEKFPNYRHD